MRVVCQIKSHHPHNTALNVEPKGIKEAGVALIVEVRALGVVEAFSE